MGNATLSPSLMAPTGGLPPADTGGQNTPWATPTPAPVTPSPAAIDPANSIAHAHVAAATNALGPNANPNSVSAALGGKLPPPVVARIMQDNAALKSAPALVANALAPPVPSPTPQMTPAQATVNAAFTPTRPQSLIAPQVVAPTAGAPNIQGSVPLGQTPAQATGPQFPATNPQDGVSPNATMQMNGPAVPNGPSTATATAPPQAPGAQPKRPSFLSRAGSFLGHIAPELAVAIATRGNPGAGAALISGYEGGQDRARAMQQQDAALKAQQALTAQNQQYKADEDRVAFDKDLSAIPNASAALKTYDSVHPKDELGYHDRLSQAADGNGVNPWWNGSEAKATSPLEDQKLQAANLKDLQGLSPEAQTGIHKSLAPDVFEKRYGVPYETWQPEQKQTDAQAAASLKQKTADDEAKQATKDTAERRQELVALTGQNQQFQESIKAQYADAPAHFEDRYGVPYAAWQPGFLEKDIIAGQNAAASTSRAASSAKDATTRLGELTERIRHDKIGEGISQGQLTNEQIRTANQAAMNAWTATHTGTTKTPSALDPGNPWGGAFDALANKREPLEAARAKAQKALQDWHDKLNTATGQLANGIYDDNGKLTGMQPTPSNLTDPITAANNQIDTIDNALMQMMKDPKTGQYRTAPPTDGPNLQSPQIGGGPAGGKSTPRSVAGKLLKFDPSQFLGTKANTNGEASCADGVCKMVSTLGVPVPKTASAADFEKQLPSKGWQQVPSSQIRKGDIVTSKGTGESGRHVQLSLGGASVLEANGRGSGYSNTIAYGRTNGADPTLKVWRYTGGGNGGTPKAAPQNSAQAAARAKLKAMGIG